MLLYIESRRDRCIHKLLKRSGFEPVSILPPVIFEFHHPGNAFYVLFTEAYPSKESSHLLQFQEIRGYIKFRIAVRQKPECRASKNGEYFCLLHFISYSLLAPLSSGMKAIQLLFVVVHAVVT